MENKGKHNGQSKEWQGKGWTTNSADDNQRIQLKLKQSYYTQQHSMTPLTKWVKDMAKQNPTEHINQ